MKSEITLAFNCIFRHNPNTTPAYTPLPMSAPNKIPIVPKNIIFPFIVIAAYAFYTHCGDKAVTRATA